MILTNTARWSEWEEIGSGGMWISTKTAGGGKVFIGYAGYGASGAGARNWAKAMAMTADFSAVVAVAGPKELYYENHEKSTANTQLLLKILPALAPERITIAAHSSGSFVGKELMSLIAENNLKPLLKKISYHDIDGGPCALCLKWADDPSNKGFNFTCVSAAVRGGPVAPNLDSMQACGSHYRELDASESGCTGAWCLHGWLINRSAAVLNPVKPATNAYYSAVQLQPNAEILK